MEKYRDMTTRKRANLKMTRNLIIFIALIVFTFWFIFKDQDLNELVKAINNVDIKYIIDGAFLMFLVYLMETINVRSVLISLGEKKFSIIRAFKYTAIGTFFSAITPAATGGQPIEIYYMAKDGIKTTNATMAMLMQLCGFQISTLLLSIISALLNPSLLKDGIIWFYLLGISINAFALIIMLLGTFSNKMAKFFLKISLKLMKLAKLNNYELRKQKLEEGLIQYRESANYIKNNKIEFVKAIFRVLIQISIYHSIPYFIYRAFGLNKLSFFELFSMQAVLYTTVSGIPLPGSIGVSETLFMKLFGRAFGKNILSGAMLLYRFVSFYFYIIIFAIIVVINAVKKKDIESEIDKDVKEIEKDMIKEKKKKLAYSQ